MGIRVNPRRRSCLARRALARPPSPQEELAQDWHDDMIWWGPAGIGATYTIERYAAQHSGPFRLAFRDRKFNGHLCRLAEGHFAGFFGWPNLTLTHAGGFMGLPASTIRSCASSAIA